MNVLALMTLVPPHARHGALLAISVFSRTRRRQPRIGCNPKTGTRVEVPAKKIPYFKPSKELKDVVNNSGGAPAKEPFPASQPPT